MNRALRATMRRSHASARFIPAPTAAPFTAATVNNGDRANRKNAS